MGFGVGGLLLVDRGSLRGAGTHNVATSPHRLLHPRYRLGAEGWVERLILSPRKVAPVVASALSTPI